MPSFLYLRHQKNTHTILYTKQLLALRTNIFTSSVITNKPKNEIARMEENEYFFFFCFCDWRGSRESLNENIFMNWHGACVRNDMSCYIAHRTQRRIVCIHNKLSSYH